MVIRAAAGMRDPKVETFATGLRDPYGIAFYPPGPDPKWVYVGEYGAVVRLPYRNGDLTASGGAETIVSDLATGGTHWTRDVAFSPDGKTLYVAVGSASNVAERMGPPPPNFAAFEKSHSAGSAWDREEWRANACRRRAVARGRSRAAPSQFAAGPRHPQAARHAAAAARIRSAASSPTRGDM
jgi:glucose/arabinose dehydrogenase